MGDLQVLAPQPNGVLTNPLPPHFVSSSSSSASSSSSSNPHPLSLGSESLRKAEETAREIICRIKPTVVSEERRKTVIEYIRRLLRIHLCSEVHAFGSVPLKTYLPDGDIDLTALNRLKTEETLATDVRALLEMEERNGSADFEVKDVQYIQAEVKLVKCLVQNIVVDISFNQLGGLGTLCFLEQVDRLIGKDYLFKRSIILIKAWCYYESRILGAHHGLISTYALETLVLYIFHLFHASLDGPLSVLYRFLDYFCKFDWDNYCISLHGPVATSSLPEIVAEAPETEGGELLLSKNFLKNCEGMFSVPPKDLETYLRAFPQKHLNIIDPMKENNNLGRSVSKGNFFRIKSAFSYGARKLGRILLLPPENIGDELNKFFQNTLDRHGTGQRPDVQEPVPSMPSCANLTDLTSSNTRDTEKYFEDKSGGTVREDTYLDEELAKEIKSIKIRGLKKENGLGDEPQRQTKSFGDSGVSDFNNSMEGNTVSGSSRLGGDAQDLATNQALGLRITSETCKQSSPTGRSEAGCLSVGRPLYAPHIFFSDRSHANWKFGNGNPDPSKSMKPSSDAESKPPSRFQSPDEEICWQAASMCEASSTTNTSVLISPDAYPSKYMHVGKPCSETSDSSISCEKDPKGSIGDPEALNTLSNLTSEYDNHLEILLTWTAPVFPIPQSLSGFHAKPSWDGPRDSSRHSVSLKWPPFSHVNVNGVAPGPHFPPSHGYYPVAPPFISGTYNVEDMPKPRGTGTYFPNMNHRSYKERQMPGRGGRNPVLGPPQANMNQFPRPRNTSRTGTPSDMVSLPEKDSHDALLSQLHNPVFSGSGRGKPVLHEFFPAYRPTGRWFPHANGFNIPGEQLEFGTFGPVPFGSSQSELGRHPESVSPHGSGPMTTVPTNPRPTFSTNQSRASEAYHLKDEDFPPLSS